MCPVTMTFVRMSIFFFLKLRTTTLVTSLSSPGRSLGSASRIVTLEPRSANVEANSQPIAPPPMTTIRSGTWSRSSTSSLDMIGPPRSKLGIIRGTDPAARMTLRPVIVVFVPSGASTVTVWSGPRLPTPLNTSTWRPLHIAAMPPTRPATILFLRCCVTAKLTDGALASMPNSAAWATWRWTAAVSRNALAGMHPRLRHVPPRASISTSAALTPADAAYSTAE